jgi:acyl-CoA synthetase (AMP-forming)/AMP-acid ligase II/1-acyl-sn-glycerol-3-phosphate acyltransferase/acyl carrier protein
MSWHSAIVMVLRGIVRTLLALRYRIDVRGLDAIAERGRRGIVFLPNHPALVDPIILMTLLNRRFRPRALADRDQISRPIVRTVARWIGVIELPDIKIYGPAVRPEVDAARAAIVAALRGGENVLLYPSGHIYRTRYEDLRGNSAAADLLDAVPDARVVLVRTRGLWGSQLSLARGAFPGLGRLLLKSLVNLVYNGILFAPRRRVSIEFHEPPDLPRDADRNTLNGFIEAFYNEDAPPALDVATRWDQRPRRRALPDPDWSHAAGDLERVPASTRKLVTDYLRELTGVDAIRDDDRLAQDLGLDSLVRAELLLWLAREFGLGEQDGDAVTTVGDVLLAAHGQAIVTRPTPIAPPPRAWFRGDPEKRLHAPHATTITAAFLDTARQGPGRVLLADQRSGARTPRDIITALLVLTPRIAQLDGTHVGLMFPASVGATLAYWATLFAGKVPVLLNWTTGARNVVHALEVTGTRHILTANAVTQRLRGQGVELGPYADKLLPLEQLAGDVSRLTKLAAYLRSWVDWSPLTRHTAPEHVAVLMTSGSETFPKLVPLSHTNVLTNIRDVLDVVDMRASDRMLGFLPPFHSFGLTVTTLAPLVAGLPVVYHPSPTEAGVLARLVQAYRATVLLGTPTFLSGILRAVSDSQTLASLRLVVTGAEKCPEHVYRMFADRCPHATALEGYGITECSPIVAVNRVENPQPGTIGRVLPSVESCIIDVDADAPVTPGQTGMLLVRGPSIFGGYLGDEIDSPFVEHDGKLWYRTGDLVSAADDGTLTFRGRLKRFAKIGGEMVSLPAIEAALLGHYARADDDGPPLAVEATPDDGRPELVLFTKRAADRATANRVLRDAGLSPLHNISRVEPVDEIPLLGNGKTDYRALRSRLDET